MSWNFIILKPFVHMLEFIIGRRINKESLSKNNVYIISGDCALNIANLYDIYNEYNNYENKFRLWSEICNLVKEINLEDPTCVWTISPWHSLFIVYKIECSREARLIFDNSNVCVVGKSSDLTTKV